MCSFLVRNYVIGLISRIKHAYPRAPVPLFCAYAISMVDNSVPGGRRGMSMKIDLSLGRIRCPIEKYLIFRFALCTDNQEIPSVCPR
jgi:hypothetical protein